MAIAIGAGKHKVLVIDVGGTHVKVLATGQIEPRKIPSGPNLTPGQMVTQVKRLVKDWEFDVVSIGYPGPVIHGRPLREPHNLGGGWVGFDFRKAFGHPVKIINDAAMQALGSYKGGRMLFLGLLARPPCRPPSPANCCTSRSRKRRPLTTRRGARPP